MAKKILKTYGWILILPILYYPYRYLNSRVLVEVFGCGCVEGFNANGFTRIVLSGVILLTLTLFTVFYIKNFGLKTAKSRIVFVLSFIGMAAAVIFLSQRFYYYQMWE